MGYIGTKAIGHLREDTDDLSSLLSLELTYAVVGLYELYGLYVDRLAGSRLIVYDTTYLALVHGSDGDHETSVS